MQDNVARNNIPNSGKQRVFIPKVEDQVKRRILYEELIREASCEAEIKALRKAYEVSRLLYINDELIIERNNQMLKV